MAKINLNDIGSGYNLADAYNANNDAIETAFDNTLSRDGSTPNQMEASLDMNSNRILNLPDADAVHEPVTLRQLTSAGTGTILAYDAANGTYTPPGTGGSARSISGKFRDVITPEDYGAAGDGSTDDTTAFTNALAAALAQDTELYLPAGRTYLISAISNANDNIAIRGRGVIKAKTSPGGDLLTLSGDDVSIVGPTFDLANLNATASDQWDGLVLSGDRAYADVTVKNMTVNTTSTTGTCDAILVTGNDSFVRVKGFNFTKNTNGTGNGSFPRVIGLSGASVDCRAEVYARNVGCVAILGSGATRPVVTMDADGFTDNGIYNLGAVDAHYTHLKLSNGEEPIVDKGTRTHAGTVQIIDCSLCIGLENSTDMTIDDLTIYSSHANRPALLWLRNGNVQSYNLHIGRIRATIPGHGGYLMPFDDGALSGLIIDSGYIKTTLDSTSSLARGIYYGASSAWLTGTVYIRGDMVSNNGVEYVCKTIDPNSDPVNSHTSGSLTEPGVGANWTDEWEATDRYFRIRDLTIEVVDNESGVTNNFLNQMPTIAGTASYLDNCHFQLVDTHSDGSQHRVSNVFQDNVALQGDYSMNSSTNYIREDGAIGRRKVINCNAAPSTGTWKVGDMVIRSNAAVATDAGSPGGDYVIWAYLCTVAGSPGTWVGLRCFTGDVT